MRAAGAACLLTLVLALACGKYGPPVRTAVEPEAEPEPFPSETAEEAMGDEP